MEGVDRAKGNGKSNWHAPNPQQTGTKAPLNVRKKVSTLLLVLRPYSASMTWWHNTKPSGERNLFPACMLSKDIVTIGFFRWYRTLPMTSDISEKFPSPALQQNGTILYACYGLIHKWFELGLLCTVCCAPTSVPLVLLEITLIVSYYVRERNCLFLSLDLLTEPTALKIYVEMGLSECLWMN